MDQDGDNAGDGNDQPGAGGGGSKGGGKTSAKGVGSDVVCTRHESLLTSKNGDVVKVDKSFGYKRAADGSLKLVLHHSSLPYEA